MRKNMTRLCSLLIAVFVLSSLCTRLQAQYDNGSLVGTIRDASAAPIVGAAVKITNKDTGSVADTRTNGSGDYEFPSLRVGVYTDIRQFHRVLRRRRAEHHRLGRQPAAHRPRR